MAGSAGGCDRHGGASGGGLRRPWARLARNPAAASGGAARSRAAATVFVRGIVLGDISGACRIVQVAREGCCLFLLSVLSVLFQSGERGSTGRRTRLLAGVRTEGQYNINTVLILLLLILYKYFYY